MNFSERDLQEARAIAVQLGFAAGGLTLIGNGVASNAWLLSRHHRSYVLKVQRQGSGRPCTYWSEALVMGELRRSGLPVPAVIAVSPQTTLTEMGKSEQPWLLLESADGAPLGEREPENELTEGFARFLWTMHRLSTNGLGPLRQEASHITGISADVRQGLIVRWRSGQFWPYDKSDLSQHPLAAVDMALLECAENLINSGTEKAEHEPNLLLHSDLHGEHIFTKDNQLAAIIDFGGAFVGPRSWEFAPIALFLGWNAADMIMESYARISGSDMSLMAGAVAVTALIFGLYRYDVESRTGRLYSEGRKIVSFLRESVKRAESAR